LEKEGGKRGKKNFDKTQWKVIQDRRRPIIPTVVGRKEGRKGTSPLLPLQKDTSALRKKGRRYGAGHGGEKGEAVISRKIAVLDQEGKGGEELSVGPYEKGGNGCLLL